MVTTNWDAGSDRPVPREPLSSLLRRWRLTAGLSQQALAERAGLSTKAITQLETGKRTVPYAETLRLLAEALGLGEEQRRALALSARPVTISDAPDNASGRDEGVRAACAALPVPRLPLIGRVDQRTKALRLLRDEGVPLLTLTGTGGVGKTRLALAIAHADAAVSRQRLAWVEFAPVTDPAFVPSTVARALGVQEEPTRPLLETLIDDLRQGSTLLILDNCEHIRSAVGDLVVHLLERCPGLRVLATSRAPLRVRGEHLFPVPPLAVPGGEHQRSLHELATTESVALFGHFARAVQPDFTLTAQNAAAVASICQHLDGLPLAIELAAARMRVLSPSALQALLEDRLRLLTGGPADAPIRHQTLRAAITWSYDLLPEEQRRLFRELAVFAGGGNLEAMSQVTGQTDLITLLEGVEALIDHSLMVRNEQEDGQLRFGMLETIREFALEQLVTEGEDAAARDAHAAWCLDLGKRTFAVLRASGRVQWFDLLETELGNLRVAFAWLGAQDRVEDTVDLAMDLFFFFDTRGYHTEAFSLFDGFLRHSRLASRTRTRAKALLAYGMLTGDRGDLVRARALLLESAGIFREANHEVYTALAMLNLGNVDFEASEFERAIEAYSEVIAIGRETNDTWLLRAGLMNLGRVLSARGNVEQAVPLFEESLAAARSIGDVYGTELGLQNLADVFLMREEYARAEPLIQEALALLEGFGHRRDLPAAKLLLARILRARGDYAGATAFLDEALAMARGIDDKHTVASALIALGDIARLERNYEWAAHLLREGTAQFLEMGTRAGIVEGLEGIAGVAVVKGDARQTARLLGAADALLERLGASRPAGARTTDYENHVRASRDTLGEGGFTAAWSEGCGVAPNDAVAEALGWLQSNG